MCTQSCTPGKWTWLRFATILSVSPALPAVPLSTQTRLLCWLHRDAQAGPSQSCLPLHLHLSRTLLHFVPTSLACFQFLQRTELSPHQSLHQILPALHLEVPSHFLGHHLRVACSKLEKPLPYFILKTPYHHKW